MARRPLSKKVAPPQHKCEECAHAYGLHEASVKGELFMLHCAMREPFSVIKTWAACDKFKVKEE